MVKTRLKAASAESVCASVCCHGVGIVNEIFVTGKLICEGKKTVSTGEFALTHTR